jgi:hypothetical protein
MGMEETILVPGRNLFEKRFSPRPSPKTFVIAFVYSPPEVLHALCG